MTTVLAGPFRPAVRHVPVGTWNPSPGSELERAQAVDGELRSALRDVARIRSPGWVCRATAALGARSLDPHLDRRIAVHRPVGLLEQGALQPGRLRARLPVARKPTRRAQGASGRKRVVSA